MTYSRTKDGQTPEQFMDLFWPALRQNAMDEGHVYGVPFHNSTPLQRPEKFVPVRRH
jgi:hypothetical protein